VILSTVYAVTRRLLSLPALLLRGDVTRSCADMSHAYATNQPTACGSPRSRT
jgi:hypothetical protein